MPKRHLLVPCSALKFSAAPESMHISRYLTSDLEKTLNAWALAFDEEKEKKTAGTLYRGQAFKYTQTLCQRYDFKMAILSAGFGLVTSETPLPSYNATFSSNENRVPTPLTSWWKAVCNSKLPGTSIVNFVKDHPEDQFIFCISNEYLKAIQDDLLLALEDPDIDNGNFVIIASRIPQKLHAFEPLFVHTSEKVLQHPDAEKCGLALTNRNITSIATFLFVEQLNLTNDSFSDIIRGLNLKLQSLNAPKTPFRTKQSDEFIIDFIKQCLTENCNLSKKSIHDRFRNEGNACSDERFSPLYKQVKKITKVHCD